MGGWLSAERKLLGHGTFRNSEYVMEVVIVAAGKKIPGSFLGFRAIKNGDENAVRPVFLVDLDQVVAANSVGAVGAIVLLIVVRETVIGIDAQQASMGTA